MRSCPDYVTAQLSTRAALRRLEILNKIIHEKIEFFIHRLDARSLSEKQIVGEYSVGEILRRLREHPTERFDKLFNFTLDWQNEFVSFSQDFSHFMPAHDKRVHLLHEHSLAMKKLYFKKRFGDKKSK